MVETGYRRTVGLIVAAVGVAMSLWHMWVIAFAPPEALFFRGGHLLFAMTLVFLALPATSSGEAQNPRFYDWLCLAGSIAFIGYLWANYDYLINRIQYIDEPTKTDQVMAVVAVALVFEATRRCIGWALPLTASVFIVYCLFGTNITLSALLDQTYLTTEGIFGSTLGVSAAYVLIFVLFGSFMERTGTGQLFMDFALALTGRQAGGPGKVSVISSSLFGTISGSAVANVMVDGPITIPLMKRTGFKPHFAAAVEAVASTGGQIMPPIMGAAAFVMAEYLQTTYFQVTLWALIPSVLYYVACFGAVHFEAKREGFMGLPKEECPRLGEVLRARGHLFIPVGIVLFGMMSGYSAPLAALAGTLACFPVAMLRANTRKDLRWRHVVDALIDGSRNALSVAMACACAGIVIGVIALTGIGIQFTQWVLYLAQNTLVLALAVTALAGIVLGMGMPTTPAYIIMVSLLVPAIMKLGVITPAAHMFAFYFAILSAITPPVALAVFAAAGLAKADLWASGWAAVKVGAAGFIVPFMFVFDPALLMIGEWPAILKACCTASLGILMLAAGLHGYLLRRATNVERALLVAAALALVYPDAVWDIVGLALGAAVVAMQKLRPAPQSVGAGNRPRPS
ncbi:MAG: TRAP transporter permease [Rhodospirillales bacterium]|nr:TRAP transporter permease [Rhodospirillales bacterium]